MRSIVKKNVTALSRLILLASVGLGAVAAQAHTGHEVTGFAAGLAHPLMGVDHLLAMLAVGVWSALAFTGKKRVLAPLAFVLALFAGAAYAVFGGLALGFNVETAIALSVLVFGVLMLAGQAVPAVLGLALVLFAGLAHGFAHGSAMLGSSFVAYAMGFGLSSIVLHALGLISGDRLLQTRQWLAKGFGLCLALTGLLLFAA